jgi:hypothetical protein
MCSAHEPPRDQRLVVSFPFHLETSECCPLCNCLSCLRPVHIVHPAAASN